jgi:GT2 family glycosyltransferase
MAVVIVSYNTRELLRSCLASVVAEDPEEVVVVDNASTDGSAQMVRDEFPKVSLLANEQNTGYGAAANQGFAACASDYVLLLNSDTRLQPGALLPLTEYLDRHPRAAVVGPRLVEPDGTLQPSAYSFPTPFNLFLEESGLFRVGRLIPRVRNRYLRTWPHDYAREVPWVLGGVMAIRRRAFDQVGGFDETIFMYQEDIDLCYRLHQAGWQVHFAPVATVVHVGGASSKQEWAQMRTHWLESTRYFYRRHYRSSLRQLQLTLLMKTIFSVRLLRDLIRLWTARTPSTRARMAEYVAVWQRALLSRW